MDWLLIVRDGWHALAILLWVCIVLGIFVTLFQSSQFRSTGSLLITPTPFLDPNASDALLTVTDTVERLVGTTAVLFPTARVYADLARDPAINVSRRRTATPDWLKRHLRVAQQGDSSILEISGTAATQRDADDLTRATVVTIASVINGLTQGGQRGAAALTIRVFTLSEPVGKVSPTPVRNLAIGANAGLILGGVAALLLGLSRRRLHRPLDVAAELDLPLLGHISARGEALEVDPGMIEVRAHLQGLRGDDRGAAILVTGTVGAERLAVVAGSLVRSLGATGDHAVLVEADLTEVAASCKFDVARTFSEAYDYIVLVGPCLDQAAELVALNSAADYALVVVQRGVRAQELQSARLLAPKVIGTLVVEPPRWARRRSAGRKAAPIPLTERKEGEAVMP